jgi:GAF domain-containing protein
MAGLAERAAETREIRLARLGNDEVTGERRDRLRAAGVESALAIPIEYDDALYGVLVVYSARSGAFGDRQRAGLADLGETIGFAITAAGRKDALVADSVLELTLRIRDPGQFFVRAATELGGSAALEGGRRTGRRHTPRVLHRDGRPTGSDPRPGGPMWERRERSGGEHPRNGVPL